MTFRASPSIMPDIQDHMIQCWPNEGVMGITRDQTPVPLKNCHEKPKEAFRVDPQEFYQHDIQLLIHSHPTHLGLGSTNGEPRDPRTPSLADMRAQQSLNITFGIASVDEHSCSDPLYFPDWDAPLEGEPYVYGVSDCYSVIQRWYWQTRGIKLKNFPRDFNSLYDDISLYDRYWREAGFTQVEDYDNWQDGDLVVMRFRSQVNNHGGVVVDGGENILHHINHRLSERVPLSRWNSRVSYGLRLT